MTSLPRDAQHAALHAFDGVPAAIGYWDRSLRNLAANAALRRLVGVDDATGRDVAELVGSEMFALDRPHLEAVLIGERQDYTRTLIDAAGFGRHVRVVLVPDLVDGRVVGFFSQLTDVPATPGLDLHRDESLALMTTMMDHAPIGKAVLTTTGRCLRVNPALCALLGYSAEELTATSLRDLTHPDDLADADAHLAALRDGTCEEIEAEKRYIRKDGSVVWVQRNAVIVRAAHGDTDDLIIAQIQDITRRKAAEEALARQATTDALTGLGNRHLLISQLGEIARSAETGVGLLYLDLDGFKVVNDTHGHTVGDELLVAVADRIRAVIGVTDSAARIGGDEFVVLVHSARTATDLERQRVRVKRVLSEPYALGSAVEQVRISVSAGSSWSGDDPASLLRLADEHMYRDKSLRPR
ncbi:diguanylate cyclase domain-containing protein [Williamsia sp. SKLECPSW1]